MKTFLFSFNTVKAVCKYPESCSEIKSCNPLLTPSNGEYNIYVTTPNRDDSALQPVSIYCYNMTSSPIDYVTLYEENYSYIGNSSSSSNTGTCVGRPFHATGETWFKKVRVIMPVRLIVILIHFYIIYTLRAGVCRPCDTIELAATIVHFKRLGSRHIHKEIDIS